MSSTASAPSALTVRTLILPLLLPVIDGTFNRPDISSRSHGQPFPATTTYRCHLPLTAATYRQAFRRLSGSLPDAQFQLHWGPPFGSSLWFPHHPMALYGSLSPRFSPPPGPSPGRSLRLSRPVFASALSAQGCRVENAHLSIYPFMGIYPIYPISARLPFDLPKPGDNSSSPPCVPFQPS